MLIRDMVTDCTTFPCKKVLLQLPYGFIDVFKVTNIKNGFIYVKHTTIGNLCWGFHAYVSKDESAYYSNEGK
jgi:hypothetical protein